MNESCGTGVLSLRNQPVRTRLNQTNINKRKEKLWPYKKITSAINKSIRLGKKIID